MKKQADIEVSEAEWLKLLYGRVDSEFALTRNTVATIHQWVISLTVAGITAVIAFGGGKLTYPTESSFVAVLALVPLMFRFFVRSCLEYTLFHRWLTIRNLLDKYFYSQYSTPQTSEINKSKLLKAIDLYYLGPSSAKKFGKMVGDNLRLAFLWPFILLIGLVAIGFVYQELTLFVIIVVALTGGITLLELFWFVTVLLVEE